MIFIHGPQHSGFDVEFVVKFACLLDVEQNLIPSEDTLP